MNNIIYIFFRRMRQPLLTLVITYSIAVLGLVLIPGQDPDGNVWHMDFFHAFYFVSYMATTIGFGEIPHAFNEAQRMWVLVSIYATVIVWLYAIGTLLSLFQNKSFQQAITERRFANRIKHLREPFYIVCGYGETGSALVSMLTERNQNVVVIDIVSEKVQMLHLENLRQYVPGLHGDAGRPVHLIEAGLEHPLCQGVIAVTNVNEVNLQIALTSKLLNSGIKVICRADSHDVEDNMASFGTDYIIDPFDNFAEHLATAIESPDLYLLNQWLVGMRHQPLSDPIYPPKKGNWIICGYGRFGKTICQQLRNYGISPIIIEAAPEKTGLPDSDIPENEWVSGRGTEAVTLEQAGVRDAVGLVAGTDNDANNLSIIMTAKMLNPDLFVVARNNLADNEQLFEAINADLVMHPSIIIANKIRVLLATPLLYAFLGLAAKQSHEWAASMVNRVRSVVKDQVPEIWELDINDERAHAVNNAILEGDKVTLAHLLVDSQQREKRIFAIPLLLLRNGVVSPLPDENISLQYGDRLLMCGRLSSHYRMEWTLQNEHALDYVRTGYSKPRSWFGQLIAK
ncbi:MAG: NAD-binding protein [Gammaproteobacteria bacterium]|nr:NAD-binding protein [Gammaproteobacteria bacterium]MDH5592574.1 NAD-binding protein [Gammaproteobacteria bacterium]